MAPGKRLRKASPKASKQEKAAEAAAADVTASSSLHEPAAMVTAGDEESTIHLSGGLVQLSKVVAPDCSGIRCVAVHPKEKSIVVARENGSLVRYHLRVHQNIPHFMAARHTGGRRQRTITSLHYLTSPSATDDHESENAAVYLVATYLSGQVVLLDESTLAPVAVRHRSGGTLWGSYIAPGDQRLLLAVSDGSWHQLTMQWEGRRAQGKPPGLVLTHIIPRVPGADRALSVHYNAAAGLAVGTDDGGHVVAWGFEASAAKSEAGKEHVAEEAAALKPAPPTRWTSNLPQGIGLCCCVCTGGDVGRAVVCVGSTAGDVVLFDAAQGSICNVFSHHKGPVSCLAVSPSQTRFYASGWHESLRSYCCHQPAADGSLLSVPGERQEWFPAEVKRRTHYHEASQLVMAPQHGFLLSASRDGTIMYGQEHRLFTSPGVYLNVSTQPFAFARARGVMMHTRYGRVEGFTPDGSGRHWSPVFGYATHGPYHVTGLWCDEKLNAIVFATDERVALLRMLWKEGRGSRAEAEAEEESGATSSSRRRNGADFIALQRMEQVVTIPVITGVRDVAFESTVEEEPAEDSSAGDEPGTTARKEGVRAYILHDDKITVVNSVSSLMETITLPYLTALTADRLFLSQQQQLIVSGQQGWFAYTLNLDGSFGEHGAFNGQRGFLRVDRVPLIKAAVPTDDGEEAATVAAAEKDESDMFVGYSCSSGRFECGSSLFSRSPATSSGAAAPTFPLPASLPADTTFIARLPLSSIPSSLSFPGAKVLLVGVFSRGVLLSSQSHWHMVHRGVVTASGVLSYGGSKEGRVMVLERNLEKALESMPLCWKVRRFGN